jgi:hypothetical protein
VSGQETKVARRTVVPKEESSAGEPQGSSQEEAISALAPEAEVSASEGMATLTPTRDSGYSVKHIVRTLAAFGDGVAVWSGAQADAEIGRWLQDGYDLLAVRSLGYGPEGVNVLWVLRRLDVDEEGHSEAKHITRRLSPGGGPDSLTGFQADALLDAYVAQGYTLRFPEPLGLDPSGGIPFLWVLVR